MKQCFQKTVPKQLQNYSEKHFHSKEMSRHVTQELACCLRLHGLQRELSCSHTPWKTRPWLHSTSVLNPARRPRIICACWPWQGLVPAAVNIWELKLSFIVTSTFWPSNKWIAIKIKEERKKGGKFPGLTLCEKHRILDIHVNPEEDSIKSKTQVGRIHIQTIDWSTEQCLKYTKKLSKSGEKRSHNSIRKCGTEVSISQQRL